MSFLSKIKFYFGKVNLANDKTSANRLFQDYLKIKAELEVSDVNLSNGINFKVSYKGSIVPFWLKGEASISNEASQAKIQDAISTIAIGLALNLNLVEVSQILKNKLDTDN